MKCSLKELKSKSFYKEIYIFCFKSIIFIKKICCKKQNVIKLKKMEKE